VGRGRSSQERQLFTCLFDFSRSFEDEVAILLVDLELSRQRLECTPGIVAFYMARLVFDEIDLVAESLPTGSAFDLAIGPSTL
jgi:hypothetical protein